jgi:hypothetical protein
MPAQLIQFWKGRLKDGRCMGHVASGIAAIIYKCLDRTELIADPGHNIYIKSAYQTAVRRPIPKQFAQKFTALFF